MLRTSLIRIARSAFSCARPLLRQRLNRRPASEQARQRSTSLPRRTLPCPLLFMNYTAAHPETLADESVRQWHRPAKAAVGGL
jgi:hypothetical protein